MKTIITIATLVCCTQLFAGHGQPEICHDDWRQAVRKLSHQASDGARDLSRVAHRHLERHPGDVEQLRVLIAARGFATAVQDLSHQLEYVRADPHCLEALVADVRERGERLAARAASLPGCRHGVQRDLVRTMRCITQPLCAITEELHRANNPPRRIHTSHRNRGNSHAYGHHNKARQIISNRFALTWANSRNDRSCRY